MTPPIGLLNEVNPINIIPSVVGTWKMEEPVATNPVLDTSGNSNNGAATGTTIVASPFFAGKTCRDANGTGDYITFATTNPLTSLFNGATVISMYAWVSLDDVTNMGRLIFLSINAGSTGFSINVESGLLNVLCRSVLTDSVQTYGVTAPSLTTKHLVYGEVDFVNKVVRISIDGNPKSTSGVLTFGANSYTVGTPTSPDELFGYNLNTQLFNGRSAYYTLLKNKSLSDLELNSLNNSYPDSSLIFGSICLRNLYKNTTLKHGYFGEENQNSYLLSSQLNINMDFINSF